MTSIRIPSRFCGPPNMANGGWACGTLGQTLGESAQVTLRKPVPLDVELSVVETSNGLELRHEDTLLAEAEVASPAIPPPSPVSIEAATESTGRFPYADNHPYPTCFVCGTKRGGDALRLHPGAVSDRGVAAAPWTVPDDLCEGGALRPEAMWAALDCPSWFGHAAFHPTENLVLLGRLVASVSRRPAPNEPCVVVGFPISVDGRKIRCGSAIFTAEGETLAHAEALWIELSTGAAA